jgi:branched-chain amino acid transport system substrate-binding protein
MGAVRVDQPGTPVDRNATQKGDVQVQRSLPRLLASLAAGTLLVGAAAAPTFAAGAQRWDIPKGQPIPVGFMGPFTGFISFDGPDELTGVKAAVAEVNAAGGVLGHPLKVFQADSASDPVDAVPAFRKLVSVDHILVEFGPTSNSGPALLPIAAQAHIPIFLQGGTTALNHETNPWFFRTTPADSVQGQAMAYFAVEHHWLKGALAFTTASSAQTLVAPITQAYEHRGGKVVATVALVPDASSYRAEILKLLAAKPQVIFFQMDPQTSGTFFSEATQLGLDHATNWIGTNLQTTSDFLKAVGPAVATYHLWMTNGALENDPAANAFNYWNKRVNHLTAPANLAPEEYDGVILAALAMTAAKSLDPNVFVKDIVKVASPPGTPCYNYAQCVTLLKAGKKINYQGAASTDDFDRWHNVLGPWSVYVWTSSGALKTVATISTQALEAFTR